MLSLCCLVSFTSAGMYCTNFHLYVDSSSHICIQVGAGWVGKREYWAYFLRTCLCVIHQTGSLILYVFEAVPDIDLFICVSVCAVRWERSQGQIVREKSRTMTPEAVRDQWDQICDFTDATKPSTVQGQDALGSVLVYLLSTRGNIQHEWVCCCSHKK